MAPLQGCWFIANCEEDIDTTKSLLVTIICLNWHLCRHGDSAGNCLFSYSEFPTLQDDKRDPEEDKLTLLISLTSFQMLLKIYWKIHGKKKKGHCCQISASPLLFPSPRNLKQKAFWMSLS